MVVFFSLGLVGHLNLQTSRFNVLEEQVALLKAPATPDLLGALDQFVSILLDQDDLWAHFLLLHIHLLTLLLFR